MSSSSCKFDSDCPNAEVCYGNVTWLENPDSGSGVCLCSTYYGFERNKQSNECTELGNTALFWVISSIVLIILALPILFITAIDLARVRMAKKHSGVLATTMAAGLITTSLLIGESTAIILNELYPVYSPISFSRVNDNTSDKIAYGSQAERILFVFMLTALFVLVMNIPIFWIEFAQRIENMNPEVITNISRLRKPFIVVEIVVCTTFIIIGPILGYFDIISTLGIPIVLIVVGIFFVGYIRLRKLLLFNYSSASSQRKQITDNSLREIRILVMTLSVGGICYLTTAAGYALPNLLPGSWREYAKPGVIPFLVVSAKLIRFSSLLLIFGIVLYCHKRIYAMTFLKDSDNNRSAENAVPKTMGGAIATSGTLAANPGSSFIASPIKIHNSNVEKDNDDGMDV